MPVKISMKPNWSSNIANGLKSGLLEMVTDVHRRSLVLVPKDTRALANSGKISSIPDGYKIQYGNARVPYARIHELGGLAGRGYSVNIRAKHYLGDAGDSVVRGNTAKYFTRKVQA